jgi:type IV pilus assembly protein PilB
MEKIDSIDEMKIKKDIWDIVEYVWNVFKNAIEIWASDIHIEPTENFLLIRIRKDWDFLLYDKLHTDHISAIITRLKVLAKVKIDENKKPQDWKLVYNYDVNNENIDVRFSTLPTKYWEKIVMRILRQDSSLTNIEALWLIDVNIELVRESLKSKYWIILVAWPTGSWKTTTLFGILKSFNPLEMNISTLEDPIEYNIEYVNQSQVKPEIWYSFATWLRTLLRQDPDIIMVWEIRDKETAILAVEAALTWHLVLSTIHTNSAAGTVQRLINMWVEPFLLVSALKMVISQRLWKKTCDNCKEEDKISDYKMKKVKEILWPIVDKNTLENLKFYKWNWCEACSFTWYRWRLWFHEVLIMKDYVEPLILNSESANTIKKAAVENWMITILQDALLKALIWKTTVDEALKLI